MAMTLNKLLERFMPLLVPIGITLGYLLPDVFIQLRPFVPWLFGLLTLAGALKMRIAEFGSTIREPLPILAFFAASHIIMPLFVLFVATIFFGNDPDIITGYVLLFSGPTAITGFIWVTIFRGDKALSLTLVLLATLLSPLLMPGTVHVLVGAKVAMDTSSIAVSLLLMVVIPTIVGVTANETSRGKIPAIVCPYLEPISKICVILVIAANVSPLVSRVQLNDIRILGIAALCVLLSVTGYLLGKLVAIVVRCNPEKSVSLCFAGGMRNLTAVTTIAVSFFPEATALPAFLGILLQQSIAVLMGKLLTRKSRES